MSCNCYGSDVSAGVRAHDRERGQRPRLRVRGGGLGVLFLLPGVPQDRVGHDQSAGRHLRPGRVRRKRSEGRRGACGSTSLTYLHKHVWRSSTCMMLVSAPFLFSKAIAPNELSGAGQASTSSPVQSMAVAAVAIAAAAAAAAATVVDCAPTMIACVFFCA